ncbi:hypothetical protein [Gynuella sunshinyii]|uniref:GLUG domain-containing protein n=1 Tax=Gynuella sunshinyii YC6258 TaxID=1445510 RepID=A0A0C5VVJ8_9GAMM|nr:hypothetical protein [Gynuella sunshinyii]AJQ97313.1 hypothetical Protein YC6258_05283 [Gynuella sunshinyii YC6258]
MSTYLDNFSRLRYTGIFCILALASAGTQATVDSDSNGLIEINNLNDLYKIRYNLEGTGMTDASGNTDSSGCPNSGCFGYELTRDLNFDTNDNGITTDDLYWNSGAGWDPIGSAEAPFNAEFNGHDHTLYNLYIDRTGEDNIGLFAAMSNGRIYNVTIDGSSREVSVAGNNNTGVLVGSLLSLDDEQIYTFAFEHNIISGNVSGGNNVGLLAGSLRSLANYNDHRLIVTDNQLSGTVDGLDRVAGVVGYINGPDLDSATGLTASISDNQVSAVISGDNYVGGLAGHIDVTQEYNGDDKTSMTSNSISGNITGTINVGGLIGGLIANQYNAKAKVLNNISTASVDGDGNLGGLIGYLESDGDFPSVVIANNSAHGNVNGLRRNVGGLIGLISIANSSSINTYQNYATGHVSGSRSVGGLMGHIYSFSTSWPEVVTNVTDSFAYGKVTGTAMVGGLIGYIDEAYLSIYVSNTYSIGQVNGQSDTGGLIGRIDTLGDFYGSDLTNVSASYWDTLRSGKSTSAGDETGYNTRTLKCPTAPGECVSGLYSGWSTTVWDFGTSSDYPVLK